MFTLETAAAQARSSPSTSIAPRADTMRPRVDAFPIPCDHPRPPTNGRSPPATTRNPTDMDDAARKTALRMIPYGLYVMTAEHGDEIAAATVNWVTQTAAARRGRCEGRFGGLHGRSRGRPLRPQRARQGPAGRRLRLLQARREGRQHDQRRALSQGIDRRAAPRQRDRERRVPPRRGPRARRPSHLRGRGRRRARRPTARGTTGRGGPRD